jgi:hypothetical protein
MITITTTTAPEMDSRLVVFSGTPVSSTNKTDRHDITEILLKVTLNTIDLSLSTIVAKHIFCFIFTDFSLESYTSLAGELLNDLTESFKQKLYEDQL